MTNKTWEEIRNLIDLHINGDVTRKEFGEDLKILLQEQKEKAINEFIKKVNATVLSEIEDDAKSAFKSNLELYEILERHWFTVKSGEMKAMAIQCCDCELITEFYFRIGKDGNCQIKSKIKPGLKNYDLRERLIKKIDKLKRYEFEQCCMDDRADMEVDEDGAYLLYEDVIKLIKQCTTNK